MAEVTECHYDVRAGQALAFGITSDKHFRIDYNYRVGDELHTGELFSEIAHPQGSLFSNPLRSGSAHTSATIPAAVRSDEALSGPLASRAPSCCCWCSLSFCVAVFLTSC